MKKKYSSSLPVLKELFPDWTDDDLIFALEDSDGDLENAIDRITEGMVSCNGVFRFSTYFLHGLADHVPFVSPLYRQRVAVG